MPPKVNGAIHNIFANVSVVMKVLSWAASCAEASQKDAVVALRAIKKLLGSLGINLYIQYQWRFATISALL